MAPVKGSVQVDDSLSTVISTMLEHGIDLVPVLDGEKVAGVVLMTNIFDIVAQFVMEHGGDADESGGEQEVQHDDQGVELGEHRDAADEGLDRDTQQRVRHEMSVEDRGHLVVVRIGLDRDDGDAVSNDVGDDLRPRKPAQ